MMQAYTTSKWCNLPYSTQLGWSEGSLVSAENLLLDYFGAQPTWWQRDITSTNVRFGPTYGDFESIQQIRLSP